jgi:hypothetical protein
VILSELQAGGKFVVFQWCFSVLVITVKDFSEVYFIRPYESILPKHIWYTLSTMILGWWGFPWGPIYTVQTLIFNFKGGKNVTQEAIGYLDSHPRFQQSSVAKSPKSVKKKRYFFIGVALLIFSLILLLLIK